MQQRAHQVHPISRRTDETHVAHGIQGAELIERKTLMHEVYRHKVHRPKAPVNPPDQLVHGAPQILILLDILSRRYSKLHKHDFPDPFRMLRQEDFERMHLLRHALDVVETINADDDFAPLEALFELGNSGLDSCFLDTVDELLGVNSDRESPDVRIPAVHLDTVRHRGETEDTCAG